MSKNKYYQYKYRANKKNIEFRLTKKSFNKIISKDCFYCKTPKAGGIDRYNNNKGYYHGNIIPCCWNCNRAKSSMSIIEFEDYLERFTGVLLCEEQEKANPMLNKSIEEKLDFLGKMLELKDSI